jgi:hypothetical protein
LHRTRRDFNIAHSEHDTRRHSGHTVGLCYTFTFVH